MTKKEWDKLTDQQKWEAYLLCCDEIDQLELNLESEEK